MAEKLKSSELARCLGAGFLAITTQVRVSVGNDRKTLLSVGLSDQGILVTGDPIPPGTAVRLALIAVDTKVVAEGQVDWVRGTTIGIKFTKLDAATARTVADAVAKDGKAVPGAGGGNQAKKPAAKQPAAAPKQPAPEPKPAPKQPTPKPAAKARPTTPEPTPAPAAELAPEPTPEPSAPAAPSQAAQEPVLESFSTEPSPRAPEPSAPAAQEPAPESDEDEDERPGGLAALLANRTVRIGAIAAGALVVVVIIAVALFSGDETAVDGGDTPPVAPTGGWTCKTAGGDQAVDAGAVACAAEVHGLVEVQRKGQSDWVALTPGTALFVGDQVRTEDVGRARLQLDTGGVADIESQSLVAVQASGAQAEGAPRGRLAIERGSANATAAANEPIFRVSEAEDLEVENAGGKEQVEYRVTARDTGAVEVAVRKGRGRGTTRAGRSVTLEAGRAPDVKDGELSGEVLELPDFPELVSPGIDATVAVGDAQQTRLVWKKADGAAGYRVDIARDQGFTDLVLSNATEKTSFSFEANEVGVLYWRVASLNAVGRRSEFGFSRRLYVSDDKRVDHLLAPADGTVLTYTRKPPQAKFSWRAAVAEVPYRFHLSRSERLDDPVIDKATNAQELTIRLPKAGTYFWGIYLDGDEGLEPLFKRPRRLEVKQDRSEHVPRKLKWK